MDSTTLATPQLDPRKKKKYYFADTPQRRFLVGLARFLFNSVMKMEVTGLENVPPRGPVVLAANHVSNFDVFPMQFALPRAIFFMSKAELFKNPLMDFLLHNLSGFPVKRGEKDPGALHHAVKVLNHSQTLGMFPEGKSSRGRGLNVAKTGAARLAIDANCPILPMAITGSDQFFKRFPYWVNVRVELLPPLFPQEGENPLALTDRLMFTLAQSLPSHLRGVYAEIPERFAMQM